MSFIDHINMKTYRSLQAKRQYSRASGWLDKGEETAISYIVSQISKPKILDIGIGGGRTVPLMQDISSSYVGIDYVRELVTICKKKYWKSDIRIMDARDLEFKSNTFDLVTFSNNGIDSVSSSDRASIIYGAYSVLKPGGYFFFSALNHNYVEESISYSHNLMHNIKSFISIPMSTYNKIRLKQFEMHNETTSVRTLNAHFNGLLATFTTIDCQIKQLADLGFLVERVYNPKGVRLDDSALASESSYIHYIARKK